jgi:hypothetical protein
MAGGGNTGPLDDPGLVRAPDRLLCEPTADADRRNAMHSYMSCRMPLSSASSCGHTHRRTTQTVGWEEGEPAVTRSHCYDSTSDDAYAHTRAHTRAHPPWPAG